MFRFVALQGAVFKDISISAVWVGRFQISPFLQVAQFGGVFGGMMVPLAGAQTVLQYQPMETALVSTSHGTIVKRETFSEVV
jgi:hypothetical protein